MIERSGLQKLLEKYWQTTFLGNGFQSVVTAIEVNEHTVVIDPQLLHLGSQRATSEP